MTYEIRSDPNLLEIYRLSLEKPHHDYIMILPPKGGKHLFSRVKIRDLNKFGYIRYLCHNIYHSISGKTSSEYVYENVSKFKYDDYLKLINKFRPSGSLETMYFLHCGIYMVYMPLNRLMELIDMIGLDIKISDSTKLFGKLL